MTQSPYDILFEPVTIGPVVAPNRFYQVPHCNGLGHRHPAAEAVNRGTKAEGGWGVVCTQEVEIHPSSEISPYSEGRLWDDKDIPAMQLMTDAVHEYGSLAGIELVYSGLHGPNRYSRTPPMSPSATPVDWLDPVQARAMSKKDIANLRSWYVAAAKRAKRAGFDIVYVYAGHNMAILQHFLTTRFNHRTDEYGGSLENRVRLVKETLTEVKEAVGDTCGIAFRFAVDELMGAEGIEANGEGREIVEMLADIPDLWDVNISDWDNDSATARFEPNEGYQDRYTAFVKQVTNKPVVGVGRYTSPDAMVARIKRGALDFIGAARPSIADPWMPNKIREGRVEDIRECIGCNICVASDNMAAPIRCTQNPTMGEEWKRGWHPEIIQAASTNAQTLVVGAGPAGLECALQLARRGYPVMLSEATDELGGRSLHESRLPGLSSYARVKDYRIFQLQQLPNVEIYRQSELTAVEISELDIDHVFIATGSSWRHDGAGRHHPRGVDLTADHMPVVSPDDLLSGRQVSGRVIVYDDDHYYMGGVVAEQLQKAGCRVTLVTPAALVSAWTEHTLELSRIQKRMIELEIDVVTSKQINKVTASGVELSCVYSDQTTVIEGDTICMVTSRQSNDAMGNALLQGYESGEHRIQTVQLIGDSLAPGTIAAAVYAGHLAARQFQNVGDDSTDDVALFRRELPALL